MTTTVYSYCSLCMCQCGTKITVDGNKVLSIEPDRENPFTWRDFCRKGKTAAEILERPERIRTPLRRVGDHYERATYAEAISDIASRLNRIIGEHGPDAVGTYSGNPVGHSFAASMFFNGLLDAIGTGNRFWVGSIDQNNAHVVQEAMYGSEMVGLMPDVDECHYFLLIGMDPAQSKFVWMDCTPDGWNRVLRARQRGGHITVVDPRRSTSAEQADTHHAIAPGQDWAFLLGMLHVIFAEALDRPATAVALSGVDDVRRLALSVPLADLAARCGIDADAIAKEARAFARAERAMCMTHTGVSHTATGTLADWLGHVLNAVTDRLDVPGGRRFERGYMDLAAIFSRFAPASAHRTRLRQQPTIAGFHSLAEMADEITTPGPGQIRAGIIVGGNPVVSGADGGALDKALSQLELLVSVDLVQRESHRHSDWLIPGTHFLEREGLHALMAGMVEAPYTMYARQAVQPPDGVLEEWEFFVELALAMKRPLFGRAGVNSLVRLSRWVAGRTGKPQLALSPAWIERALVMSGRRLRYRDILAREHGWLYGEREYGNLAGALRHPDKTVHCAPTAFLEETRRQLSQPTTRATSEFPYLLVNRRRRESINSWVNENPGLHSQERRNTLELHPDDAGALDVADGQRVRVCSAVGQIELPVHIEPGGRRGVVTIAHGWGSRIFDPLTGTSTEPLGANRNLLVDRDHLDPLSQTPSLNGTPVRVERLELASLYEPAVVES